MQKAWLEENANQLMYYRDKIGVCNVICFCQCARHESVAILLVKPRDKQSPLCKEPMYVLPGGKRDFKEFRQTEPCWEAVVREFQEEAGDNLNLFCKKKCKFFEETLQVNLNVSMVTDQKLKDIININKCKYIQNYETLKIDNKKQINTKNQSFNQIDNCQHIDSSDILLLSNKEQTPNSSNNYQPIQKVQHDIDMQKQTKLAETDDLMLTMDINTINDIFPQSGADNSINQDQCKINVQYNINESKQYNQCQNELQVTRRIRSYFIEVNCCDIPDQKFGRFNLYEMSERKWFDLEFIISQFKEQYQDDKTQMTISPKLFKCMSRFGGKLVNIQQKQLQKLNFVYILNANSFTIDDVNIESRQPEQVDQYINDLVLKINKTHQLFSKINYSIKKQPIIVNIDQNLLYI